MPTLSNIPFDEIVVGQTATYTKTVTDSDIRLFATATGDINPVHLDEEFAAQTLFKGRIAHGMLTAGLISAALATRLPGPGCVYLSQTLEFLRPVKIDDTVTVYLKVLEKDEEKKQLTVEAVAKNQKGKAVVSGTACLIAAVEKISIEVVEVVGVTVG